MIFNLHQRPHIPRNAAANNNIKIPVSQHHTAEWIFQNVCPDETVCRIKQVLRMSYCGAEPYGELYIRQH